MNLEQLISQFRVDATDLESPPLFLDEWIAGWLTEAVAEAAIRGRLIMEAANPAVCQIAVTADVAVYPLHPALFEIVHMRFKPTGSTRSEPVTIKTREELDRIRPGWRDCADRVEFAIQDDTRIQLVGMPKTAGVLYLEGYRVPLKALANDNDKPEIGSAHHHHLVHWALHRAFSRPDADTFDAKRAAAGETAFTAYFGTRPDSDLRRSTRSDEVQTNKVFWA